MSDIYAPVELHPVDKSSPYYKPLIPEPQFSELYNKLKQYAVGYLCSLEPSKSEEFKQLPVKFNEELEMKEREREDTENDRKNKEERKKQQDKENNHGNDQESKPQGSNA